MKILIADDDVSLCRSISLYLKHVRGKNYELIFAHTGKEALEKIQKNELDVAFLDELFCEGYDSKLTGREVCRKVKENGLKTKICGMGKYCTPKDWLDAGVDYTYTKESPDNKGKLIGEYLDIIESSEKNDN